MLSEVCQETSQVLCRWQFLLLSSHSDLATKVNLRGLLFVWEATLQDQVGADNRVRIKH